MKTDLTKGQQEFEKYCRENNITLFDVPRHDGKKTPDYKMVIGNETIIVEVKDIERNPTERKSDEENDKKYGVGRFRSRGSDTGGMAGDRVRNKIKKASSQIADHTGVRYSGLLVLYEHDFAPNHTHPMFVRYAMYGSDEVCAEVGSNQVMDWGSGGGQRMTSEQGTSISAVAVLWPEPSPDNRTLCIYHNEYARVPIDPAVFDGYRVRQFEHVRDKLNWREVGGPGPPDPEFIVASFP